MSPVSATAGRAAAVPAWPYARARSSISRPPLPDKEIGHRLHVTHRTVASPLREPVSGPRHPQPFSGDRGLVSPAEIRQASAGGRMSLSETLPAEFYRMPGVSGHPDGDPRHLPSLTGVGPHLPSPGEPPGADHGLPLVRLCYRRRRGSPAMEQCRRPHPAARDQRPSPGSVGAEWSVRLSTFGWSVANLLRLICLTSCGSCPRRHGPIVVLLADLSLGLAPRSSPARCQPSAAASRRWPGHRRRCRHSSGRCKPAGSRRRPHPRCSPWSPIRHLAYICPRCSASSPTVRWLQLQMGVSGAPRKLQGIQSSGS